MKKLSTKSYWAKLYNPKGFNNYSKLKSFFSYSLQNYEYFRIIKKYKKSEYKNIIEVGCAPGIFLIKAHEKLNLIPYGVDYTKNGKLLTDKNLKENKIKKFEIYCADVFSKKFQKENSKKYDVVFSNGFVEHFDDFKKTMDSHINITKVGGLIVVSIPNLLYFNKYFTIQEVNEICNLKVMELDFIKENLPLNVEIKHLGYYGGLFNIGVFFSKNKYLEFLRKLVFIGQRLIFDPIFILLCKMRLTLNWKYSSPAIVLVCERKK